MGPSDIEPLLARRAADPANSQLGYQCICACLRFFCGTDCFYCTYPAFGAELIPLFSMDPNDNIESFKLRLESQVKKCCKCIDAFHRARGHWIRQNQELYGQEKMHMLSSALDRWSTERLSRVLLENRNFDSDVKTLFHAVYEILGHPRLLRFEHIAKTLADTIESGLRLRKMLRLKKLLPGIFVLLFGESPAVRQWAHETCVSCRGVLDVAVPEDFLAEIKERLSLGTRNTPEPSYLSYMPNAAFLDSFALLSVHVDVLSQMTLTLPDLFKILCEHWASANTKALAKIFSICLQKYPQSVSECLEGPTNERAFLQLIDQCSKVFYEKNLLAGSEPIQANAESSSDTTVYFSWIRPAMLATLGSSFFILKFQRLLGILFDTQLSAQSAANAASYRALAYGISKDLLYTASKQTSIKIRNSLNAQAKSILKDVCESKDQALFGSAVALFLSLIKFDALNLEPNIIAFFENCPYDFNESGLDTFWMPLSRVCKMLPLKSNLEILNDLSPFFALSSLQSVKKDVSYDCIFYMKKWLFAYLTQLGHHVEACGLWEELSLALLPFALDASSEVQSAAASLIARCSSSQYDDAIKVIATSCSFHEKLDWIIDRTSAAEKYKVDILETSHRIHQLLRLIGTNAKKSTAFRFYLHFTHVISKSDRTPATMLSSFMADLYALSIGSTDSESIARQFISRLEADPAEAFLLDIDPKKLRTVPSLVENYSGFVMHWLGVAGNRAAIRRTILNQLLSIANKLSLSDLGSAIEKTAQSLGISLDISASAHRAQGIESSTTDGPAFTAEKRRLQVEPLILQTDPAKKAKQMTLSMSFGLEHPPKAIEGSVVGNKLKQLRVEMNREKGSREIRPSSINVQKSEPVPEDVDLLEKNRIDYCNAVEQCTKKQIEPRKVQLIDVPLSASRMAMMANEQSDRLKPKARDMNAMYKIILDNGLKKAADDALKGLSKISKRFSSFSEYFSAFEPLILSECHEQIEKSREELLGNGNSKATLRVLGGLMLNEFCEIKFYAKKEDGENITEADLVRLRTQIQNDSSQVEDLLAVLTMVKGLKEGFEVTARCLQKNIKSSQKALIKGTYWNAQRLCNLMTINREYSALCSVETFYLFNHIMSPAYSTIDSANIAGLRGEMIKVGLNDSQAEAAAWACRNPNPFTLIQGPPGTGKTSTIMGIISAFLSGRISSSIIRPPISANGGPSDRLLICAPSNAAVDEIVRRLGKGVLTFDGQTVHPSILRFGTSDLIHEDVRPFTLDYIVDRLCREEAADARDYNAQIRLFEARIAEIQASAMADTESAASIQDLRNKIRSAKDMLRSQNRALDDSRVQMKLRLLRDAQIICCTLSGSGHEMMQRMEVSFETVIIDEACQAVEPSSLIPLRYGCRRCILIGDPNQLPPTVISQGAQDLMYEQSLFQRIQSCIPDSVRMLGIQYRMHPEISQFPGKYFYGSRLKDDLSVLRRAAPPWHVNPSLGAWKFFDVYGFEEKAKTKSLSNVREVDCVFSLVHLLCNSCPEESFSGRIGIITPYKQQLRELKRRFVQAFGAAVLSSIEINTVDGFQGKEKDIIIVSCVRSNEQGGLGFVTDVRRMNVAMTRARHSLFILGDSRSLCKDKMWRSLIEDAKARAAFVPYARSFWESIDHRRIRNLVIYDRKG